MPTGTPSGEIARRQRAGREGDVGSVLGIAEASMAGESEGAKAMVSSRVWTVALTASDSRS